MPNYMIKSHPVTVYRVLDDIRILMGEASETLDGVHVVPGSRLPVAELFY
ncbi:MAG: hypothetical protein M3151_11525 [Actinomycetota bacterium]|nr:hypothetical protein [Actinomycetota bacterium]